MVGLVTPIQRDDILGQFFNQLGIMQDDVSPKHHLPVPLFDLAINTLEEIDVNPAFAQAFAEHLALSATQIPGLITTHIKFVAREKRQQLVIKFSQKGQGGGMVWRQGGGVTEEGAGAAWIRFLNFAQFL